MNRPNETEPSNGKPAWWVRLVLPVVLSIVFAGIGAVLSTVFWESGRLETPDEHRARVTRMIAPLDKRIDDNDGDIDDLRQRVNSGSEQRNKMDGRLQGMEGDIRLMIEAIRDLRDSQP